MAQQNNALDWSPPTIEVQWPCPGVAQVVLNGEYDLATVDQLGTVLTETLEGCSTLIVDLSSTEFIDSTTISVLIATKRRADASERNFQLLVATSSKVERVLEVTGVLTALNRVQSLDQVRSPQAVS